MLALHKCVLCCCRARPGSAQTQYERHVCDKISNMSFKLFEGTSIENWISHGKLKWCFKAVFEKSCLYHYFSASSPIFFYASYLHTANSPSDISSSFTSWITWSWQWKLTNLESWLMLLKDNGLSCNFSSSSFSIKPSIPFAFLSSTTDGEIGGELENSTLTKAQLQRSLDGRDVVNGYKWLKKFGEKLPIYFSSMSVDGALALFSFLSVLK